MFNVAKYDTNFTFHHKTGVLIDSFDEFKNSTTGLDLVILGKRGESSNYAKEHLGSSLERILRTSPCPCFIASNSFYPLKNILIAYDASNAINKAIQFIERNHFFKNCTIHILTVNATDEMVLTLQKTQNILNTVADLNVTIAIHTGDIIDEIQKYTEENNIDLLIIGAYSHSIVKHFLVGSTTLETVRQSKTPVVVFR